MTCGHSPFAHITQADQREIRAFQRFLGRLASQPLPGSGHVIALDHWDYDYAMGGPTPPWRWEGDDS